MKFAELTTKYWNLHFELTTSDFRCDIIHIDDFGSIIGRFELVHLDLDGDTSWNPEPWIGQDLINDMKSFLKTIE